MKPITEVWAFVQEVEGEECTVGIQSPSGKVTVFITADAATRDRMRKIAEKLATDRGVTITLKRFSNPTIVAGFAGVKSITCPKCARTSYHPKDVEEGYCGNCHEFWRGKQEAAP